MISRPEQQLQELLREYPKLAQHVDLMCQGKGKDIPSWPNDVLLPFGAWIAIEQEYYPNDNPLSSIDRTSKLAALSTWRYAKGVYRFSRAMYDALTQIDLPEIIPMRVFRRMPDWCPYLELPEKQDDVYGYFCYLDYEYRSGAWELRIFPDSEKSNRVTVPIELTEGISIRDATAAFGDIKANRSLFNKEITDFFLDAIKREEAKGTDIKADFAKTAEIPLKLLLYLCSDAPEIDDEREPGVSPARSYHKKVKGGYRLFEPTKTRTWEVGKTISRAISAMVGKPGSKKAPHIRRAHWHGYWKGPRDGEQTFMYHLIPPIAVNVEDAEDLYEE